MIVTAAHQDEDDEIQQYNSFGILVDVEQC